MTKLIDILKKLDATIARPFGLHISIDGNLVPLGDVMIEEYEDFILITRVENGLLIVSRLLARSLFDMAMVSRRLAETVSTRVPPTPDHPSVTIATSSIEAPGEAEPEPAPTTPPTQVSAQVKHETAAKPNGARLTPPIPGMTSMLGAVLGPGVKASIL